VDPGTSHPDEFAPAALIAVLQPYIAHRRWWLAYSGGVDSHVLLHAVAALRSQLPLPPLTALHVNHQINPRAAAWAEHCVAVCAALGIDCVVEPVRIDSAGTGLEAAARTARYATFARHVGAGEVLLQAHHADDQVETLLLRLLRGSGMAGLAAMPQRRPLDAARPEGGELLRPLLPYRREQLLEYARLHRLQWVHDDSNDDAALDRNFLRLRVLPLLGERWPAYRDTLQRVVDNATEARGLLQEVAVADHAGAVWEGGSLRVDRLLALGAAHRPGLVGHWLGQQRLPPPSRAQLAQVLALCMARDDAEPCVSWPGVEIHRFRGGLYALQPLPAVSAEVDVEWRPERLLTVAGLGELRATAVGGAGLRADREYRVRNRRGGERCRPLGRAHSQTLKKLLQEYAVPPWLRDRLPLVYCGDELAAVGDLWVCDGFQAEGDALGWRIEWHILASPMK
jgi:tRNA(Ile)-lysidine synthase